LEDWNVEESIIVNKWNEIKSSIANELNVKESSIVIDWMAIGFARGYRKGRILGIGTERFGPAADVITAALDGITDNARLDRIYARASEATDWNDLLATP
jgi:hypothetical protein